MGEAKKRFTQESLERDRREFLNFFISDGGGLYPYPEKEQIRLDFTLESLRRLESFLLQNPKDYRKQVLRVSGPPNPVWTNMDLWKPHEGLGSYFGEVLVRNLGGTWQGPSKSLVDECRKSGEVDPLFQQWYVVVNCQNVPVFDLAGRRNELGPTESLQLAYDKIANGSYRPPQQPFVPRRVPRIPLRFGWILGFSIGEMILGLYFLSKAHDPVMQGVGGTLIAFSIALPINALRTRKE
jgi:hypothetical protein